MRIALPYVSLAALVAALEPDSLSAQRPEVSPAFSAAELTAWPTDSWITNGGNVYNQRYSPLVQINRDNVAALKPRWRTSLNGSGTDSKYSGQAQPLVYAGVIYIPTGANDVFAIDVESGDILWTHEANLDPEITVICCGWMSRGVAMGDGKIYSGQLDGKLVALDQATGAVVWSVQAEHNDEGFSITSAPLYYDGLVITGFAGGDRASRGRVKAFNAETGELVWTFYTIPGPGEFGHDTWPDYNDTWEYGGAAVWQTPAVDPDLGLVYFSTGNPGPDLNGSVRPGDNLICVSMVAIEAKTGKYRWHFQQVHHDLWDYDSPNPVILFDAEYDGRMRKGIVEVGKTGFVYILDRETGEPLIGIEERPVPQEPRQATSPTQPFPIGDEIIPHEIDIAFEGFELVNQGRIFTPFWDKPVIVKPLGTGGANWPPSSYDPETNIFYGYSFRNPTVVERRRCRVGDADAGRALFWRRIHAVGLTEARHLRGRRSQDKPARMAQAVGRDVLRGVDRHARRSDFHRPQRRPLHGARQGERRLAVGIPGRCRYSRGGEHIRARWPTVRRRARGGLVLPQYEARRQRMALLARGRLRSERRELGARPGRRPRDAHALAQQSGRFAWISTLRGGGSECTVYLYIWSGR